MMLIAQEVHSGTACNSLALFRSKFLKLAAFRFVNGFKFLKAFVAGNHEQVILIG